MLSPCHLVQRDLGLLRLEGPDARGFLHAQTTQSVTDMPALAMRLAAWLNPKGRVRSLFNIVADGDTCWLVVPADLVSELASQLGRYVLRSRVRIELVQDHGVWSLCGENRDWLAAQDLELAAAYGSTARLGTGLACRIGERRIDVIAPLDRKPEPLTATAMCTGEAAALEAIALGLPRITAALAERYVPQMLNLDRLDAISFTKGCYPGQEIVARTQNLGQVKRRLARFAVDPGERPMPGMAIVDAADQAVGEVNRAAQSGSGYELLAVVALDADRHALRLATDARALTPSDTAPTA